MPKMPIEEFENDNFTPEFIKKVDEHMELMETQAYRMEIWETWVAPGANQNVVGLVGRFTHREDALACANQNYGSVRQAIVYGSYEVFTNDVDEQLRSDVLKCLSDDEKRVLGL